MVVSGPNGPTWSSNTGGRGGTVLFNQSDGNLVMNDAQGHTLCAFGTGPNRPNAYLRMQNDGHLVVYAPNYGSIWDSTRGGQCV